MEENKEIPEEMEEQLNGLGDLSSEAEVELIKTQEEIKEVTEIKVNIPTPIKEVSKKRKNESKTLAIYPYKDMDGKVLYEIMRRTGKGQPYLTRYKDENGEYQYKLPEDVEMVIYNLPEVRQAIEEGNIIWITEGESKADTLNKLGFTATTCAFKGAYKWADYYNKYLEGAKTVLILVDNDNNSEEFAENTAQTIIDDLEVNIEVYKYRLNEICSIKQGGDIDDLIKIIGEERTIDTLKTIEANH